MLAVDRATLRRCARQVQRREDPAAPWDGEEPLWIVAPHVPAVLSERRTLAPLAPGVHRVDPSPFPFLWIAANDLPLADELVPFLIARSGRALDAFVAWVKTRRQVDWLLHVLECLPMSNAAESDLRRYVFTKTDDPRILAQRRKIAKWALEASPETREEVFSEGAQAGEQAGRLAEARSSLRHVLAARGLAPSTEDEARIDACTDLDTLHRWIDQAVVAPSVAGALR
jgi:hypothetical protein